jgi:hypothetical protein
VVIQELVHNVASALEEYNGSTWTAGGAINTARSELGGAGTQTAGLAFGGNQIPGKSGFNRRI